MKVRAIVSVCFCKREANGLLQKYLFGGDNKSLTCSVYAGFKIWDFQVSSKLHIMQKAP